MSIKSWYEKWICNPKAIKIANNMRQHPEKWVDAWSEYEKFGKFRVVHVESRISVWTGNGWWFCSINNPHEEKLGVVGRTLVWSAFKYMRKLHKPLYYDPNKKYMDLL